MKRNDADGPVRRFEITGDLDPHALEALRLEIRRLAGRHGVAIKELRVETATDDARDASA